MRVKDLALLSITLIVSITVAWGGNPCCSYPCENGGVCMTKGDNYYCDCTGLDFSGKNCETPTFMKRIKLWLKPAPSTLHSLMVNNKWLWNIVNNIGFLREYVMKKVLTMRADLIDSPPTYENHHDYITMDSQFNYSQYTRTLPPVPSDCPTPMGIWGKKEMPDVGEIVNAMFVRKEFLPDPRGSSTLFSFFAQHFTHCFFKTDIKKGPEFQWGGHGLDVTHVYGKNKHSENLLRSFKDGKMKTQVINGEEWPPNVDKVPVDMTYPGNVPKENRFAMGHEFYGLLPGLLMYGTIWVREHNRVCDIMKKEHPEWDDERLFQTVKLIILGETIKVVIEDYVQHLSNYNYKLMFKPDLLFGELFQYQNRIALEFNHLYHWHPLMPDEFNINGTKYNLKEFLFHPEVVVKHGMREFVDSLSKQRAGAFGPYNHGPFTIPVVRDLISHGRKLRLQPFNNYRKKFNMKPVKTFEELTGEKKLSKILQNFYGDINAVEFYVGLIAQKRREKAMFGETLVEIGAPYFTEGADDQPHM
ncbi:hypothetical protein FSP39_014318 [Pinctada imbricata]|uniref:prostaglandin-endoperoxide synthase n=1 Tax=Pinctada imbricata TaxID=66713 RepID=A0AA88XVL7_PINIB|nr:hypothetical protein FSP39_014318 [Pinctada imbricata]